MKQKVTGSKVKGSKVGAGMVLKPGGDPNSSADFVHADKANGKDRLRGSMLMGGTIHVAAPNAIETLSKGEELCLDVDGMEICIQVEDAPKPKVIEMTPYAFMTDADIEIIPDAIDGDPLDDNFMVTLKDGSGNSIGAFLAVDQVRSLHDVLGQYLSAFDTWEGLRKSRTVRTEASKEASRLAQTVA